MAGDADVALVDRSGDRPLGERRIVLGHRQRAGEQEVAGNRTGRLQRDEAEHAAGRRPAEDTEADALGEPGDPLPSVPVGRRPVLHPRQPVDRAGRGEIRHLAVAGESGEPWLELLPEIDQRPEQLGVLGRKHGKAAFAEAPGLGVVEGDGRVRPVRRAVVMAEQRHRIVGEEGLAAVPAEGGIGREIGRGAEDVGDEEAVPCVGRVSVDRCEIEKRIVAAIEDRHGLGEWPDPGREEPVGGGEPAERPADPAGGDPGEREQRRRRRRGRDQRPASVHAEPFGEQQLETGRGRAEVGPLVVDMGRLEQRADAGEIRRLGFDEAERAGAS